MSDDPNVLQLLGRMEGKLDAALQKLDGHDADIDELRRDQAATAQQVTSLRTTQRVAWGAIIALFGLIGTLAAVWAAVHGA